jgi:hypothetical protein
MKIKTIKQIMYALHRSYSEGVSAAKIVYYNLVFTINKLNLIIN